jgi:hypothetical protein
MFYSEGSDLYLRCCLSFRRLCGCWSVGFLWLRVVSRFTYLECKMPLDCSTFGSRTVSVVRFFAGFDGIYFKLSVNAQRDGNPPD